MNTCQIDEKIAENLNKHLSEVLKGKEQCISNSVVFESREGSHIMYMARDKKQELLMVIISLNVAEETKNIRLIPISAKNELKLDGMQFEILESPSMYGCYVFVAYDPNENSENSKGKLVYLSPIHIDNLDSVNVIELHEIQTRNHGKVKDVKWHPFASLTLIALTESKIITFKLDEDYSNPINEIYLKNLTLSFTHENTKNETFEQIAFAEILNHKETYSSLGKKLSLYLISKTGQIYLLFPFLCPQLIINETEEISFSDLKENFRTSKKSSNRSENILRLIKNSRKIRIENDENEKDQEEKSFSKEVVEYILEITNINDFEVELFKLSSVVFWRQSENLGSRCHSINTFKVLTMNYHTIFLHGERLVSKEQRLKVQILSEEPYSKLINISSELKTTDFSLEIVGEFKLGISERKKNEIQLITENSMTNEIFLLHNNMVCYRFSFDGLSTLLTTDSDSTSGKLIDCDVLFKSNTEIITIVKNLFTIFFIRYESGTYFFQSVPLQSIQLREIIRSTIAETENLFKELAKKPEPKRENNMQKFPELEFEKLNESTLINIEKKLSEFSNDSKKYIETKLERIKKLSEDVMSKQSILEQQQSKKEELIKLINKAEENDKTIKEMTSNNRKDLNKTERNLERRIKGMHKTLEDMKQAFDKENESIEQDEEKLEIMTQCKEQADAVIDRLEDTKQKLIEKRDQLKKLLTSS